MLYQDNDMSIIPNIRHALRIWLANARASITREMGFRANFILGIIRQIAWFTTFVIFIQTIFSQTDSLAGWSREEMFIILALSRIVEGLMSTLFVENLMHFTGTVNKGEFDFYLLKPTSAQFLASFRNIKLDNIGNILAGTVLLVYALTRQTIHPTLLQIISFIIIVVAGMCMYYSLLLIVATLAFRLERLQSLWGFNALFSEPLTVPFDVFPARARIALTYILPIAFAVFIPAQTLTNKVGWYYALFAVALAGLFLFLAHLAWKAGLSRYTSASS